MSDAPPAAGSPSDTAAADRSGLIDAVDRPTASPRFGQLTYARLLGAAATGGWQMRAEAGGVTRHEQELLVAAVTDVTVDARLLSPAPDAVDALPRRLVHGPVSPSDAGATAYWHCVPTGIDTAARPDRVFAHVVLDRAPAAPHPPLRPSDMLRSPVWLRPYGAAQLISADPGSVPDPPWPAPVLGRAAVLAFLTDKALWRGGTLRGLLDAVHAAMGEGPTVVLGVVDPADADRWVAAVCHLMSPGTGRRFFFSTAAHVGDLPAARAGGLHLIVVPAAELGTVERDETVVLISDEDVVDGSPAVAFVDYDLDQDTEQVHTTAYGSLTRATPWSMIAAAVLHDPAVAATLLARQDAVAAEVGDSGLSCVWPLALAVAERALDRGDDPDVLDDALPVADLVVRIGPTPSVAGTALQGTLERVRERALGRTAASAWAALDGGLPPGVGLRFAKGVYLERAVRDREWLLRDGGVPVPDMFGAVSQLGDRVVVEAHTALDGLGTRPDQTDVTSRHEAAAVALRLLDLVARVGLAAHLEQERVGAVLDGAVGPVLLHAIAGPELVERVGPLTEAVQARVVRPWLDRRLPQLPGRPGCRVAPPVLRWLFPEPPGPPTLTAAVPPTVIEAAAQATLVLPDRSAFRAVALLADLAAAPGGLATRAGLGPGLPADAMLALLDRTEPHRLAEVLTPALLSAPSGADLDALLRRLLRLVGRSGWDTAAGLAVRRALTLRTLELSWPGPAEEGDHQPGFRQFARLLRPLAQAGTPLAPDLLTSGSAADVVDRVHGFDDDAGAPLAAHARTGSAWADADFMVALARRVAHAVGAGVTTDLQVVLAAQLGANTVGGVRLGPASWPGLTDLTWCTPAGRPQGLLDHVARLRFQEVQRDRPDELQRLVAAARDWVARAAEEHRNRLDPHHALSDYDRFAAPWWRRLGVLDDEPLRGLSRRVWRS